MTATRSTAPGIAVLKPTGRIDTQGAIRLASALRRATSSGARLVVDMSDVTYIGSKGLQALISALAECRHAGGDLKLASVPANVLHVLEIIQFDCLFSVYPGVESAIAGFQVGSTAGVGQAEPRPVA